LATSPAHGGAAEHQLVNSTNKYLDELVAAQITTGSASVVAEISRSTSVGSLDDTPTWPDAFTGTDAARTITSADIKASICALVGGVANDTTASRKYAMKPLGIRQLFGDGLPPGGHVIFVTHSSSAVLSVTATDHFVKHTPVYATVI
jgi:hypothetical protein